MTTQCEADGSIAAVGCVCTNESAVRVNEVTDVHLAAGDGS